jgi:hypothetical protein
MNDRLRRTARFAWLLAIASWACDGNGGTSDTGDHDADAVRDDVAVPDTEADGENPEADDAGPDDAGPDDAAPDHAPPCMESSAACVETACHAPPFDPDCVGGTVRDSAGDGIPYQAVALCGGTHCYFGYADVDGFFGVSVPDGVTLADLALYFPSAQPVLTPFCRYDQLCDGAIHLCDDFRLFPAPTAGTDVGYGTLAEEKRIVAEDGAMLVFPAGDEVLLPIDAVESWVALSRFPLAEHVPCFVDPANLPLALYAVTPHDTYLIEPGTMTAPVFRPAALDVPNETGLAAGTVVDVYVLGGSHAVDAAMAEGEWRATTTATVSTDGTRIRTAAGEGFGYLTWFALYAR